MHTLFGELSLMQFLLKSVIKIQKKKNWLL